MKRFLTFVIALIMIFAFSGCGGKMTAFDSANNAEWKYQVSSAEAPMEAPMPELEEAEYGTFDSSTANSAEKAPDTARKMIRTFNLTVETLEFEDFINTLSQKVNTYGGYIESSDIEGNSYNYNSNRYASFTCRIPSNKLDEFVNTVDGLGNVTYRNENQQDVTLTYVDTEARITSLQTEYDRLIELLTEAENLDSVIVLEERLSEVRYQLESYKSQLRTYDNLVDYSTVYVNVNEVKRVTSTTETKTVWERISTEFDDNLYDVWCGLEDFFVWAVASTPYFAIFAVIVIIIVVIIKLLLNRSPRYKAKKAAKKAERERLKAEKAAKKNGNEITAKEEEKTE